MDISIFDLNVDDDYNDYYNNNSSNSNNYVLDSYDSNIDTVEQIASTIPTASLKSTGSQKAPQKSSMVCDQCGSTNIHKEDGRYVCKDCGKVAQNYVDAYMDIEWEEAASLNVFRNRIDGSEHILKDKMFRESKTTTYPSAIKFSLEEHLDVLVDPKGPIAAPPKLRDVVLILFDTWVEKQ